MKFNRYLFNIICYGLGKFSIMYIYTYLTIPNMRLTCVSVKEIFENSIFGSNDFLNFCIVNSKKIFSVVTKLVSMFESKLSVIQKLLKITWMKELNVSKNDTATQCSINKKDGQVNRKEDSQDYSHHNVFQPIF